MCREISFPGGRVARESCVGSLALRSGMEAARFLSGSSLKGLIFMRTLRVRGMQQPVSESAKGQKTDHWTTIAKDFNTH